MDYSPWGREESDVTERLSAQEQGREQDLAADPKPRDSPAALVAGQPFPAALFSLAVSAGRKVVVPAHPAVARSACLQPCWGCHGDGALCEAPLGPLPWRAVPLSGDNGALKDRGVSGSL